MNIFKLSQSGRSVNSKAILWSCINISRNKKGRSAVLGLVLSLACLQVRPSVVSAEVLSTSQEVSTWIDDQLAHQWRRESITPADRATDSEWVRRVYLDLIGRIPSVFEVRSFLESTDTDKDQKLIEDLLARGSFSQHWADVTVRAMLPETTTGNETVYYTNRVNTWLREHFQAGRGYDQLAREFVNWQVADYDYDARSGSLGGIYAVKKSKPEELAAVTSRFLLGIRLECAQCHDHPFAKWKRREFWQLAAFYAGLERNPNNDGFQAPRRENKSIRSIKIEGTDETVEPVFLTASATSLTKDQPLREALAEWIVTKDNPFFARCSANRVWAQLFGMGIVNPVDDMDSHNPPSHPEILDRLATEFVAHDYDILWLIRTIAGTRAYRLSSRPPNEVEIPPRSFARMIVRTMTPQQFCKSFSQATGVNQDQQAEFMAVFRTSAENPAQSETSIVQALAQMNSVVTGMAVNPRYDFTLSALMSYPAMSLNDRIDTLYLAALARYPVDEERAIGSQLVAHYRANTMSPVVVEIQSIAQWVQGKKVPPRPQMKPEDAAVSDLFWVILNSSEFALNH